MKLEQSIEVGAPLQRVWEALVDVERVAPCLPGAEVTGRNDDGSYDGTFKVKIGPTSAAYSGKLHMDAIDEGAHTATMHAQGTDRRGQGGAKATIVSSVAAVGADSTRVEVNTDYHITGRLARFGRRGMIEEISNRLLNEFAQSLQEMLAGDGQEAAVEPVVVSEVPAVGSEVPAVGSEEPVVVSEDPVVVSEEPMAAGEPEAVVSGTVASATPPLADELARTELAAIVPEADVTSQPDAVPPAAPHMAPPAPPPEPAGAPPPPAGPPPPTPAGDESPFPGATPPPPNMPRPNEPIQALSMMGPVLWSRAKRNPAPILGLVLGFLLALIVFRRRD